jgi:hypothetical protein
MQDTVEWDGLLGAMTEEELTRYQQIAGDQATHERKLLWLQVVLVVAAVGVLAWGVYGLATAGYSSRALLALGLSPVLGYWPYRKIRTRRLWAKHCRAIDAELERRRARSA